MVRLALTLAVACLTQAVPASADAVLPQQNHVDLQAHRGGIGLTTESTLRGFAKAIELSVTTLELNARGDGGERHAAPEAVHAPTLTYTRGSPHNIS